jgi:hypothetical protein
MPGPVTAGGTTTAAAIPPRRRPAAPGRRRPTGRSASRRASAVACPATATSPVERPAVHADGDQHAAHLARLLQHRAWPAGGLRGGAVQARARPASSRRAARPGSRRGRGSPATAREPVRCGRPRRNPAPPRCRPRPVRPAVRDRAAQGPVATSRPSGRLAARSGMQWTRGSRSSALLLAAGAAAHTGSYRDRRGAARAGPAGDRPGGDQRHPVAACRRAGHRGHRLRAYTGRSGGPGRPQHSEREATGNGSARSRSSRL